MAKKNKPPVKNKRMLTLFFMIIPSLLIAMSSSIDSYVTRLAFQILLIIFQIVIFKNFIDSYYGEEGIY